MNIYTIALTLLLCHYSAYSMQNPLMLSKKEIKQQINARDLYGNTPLFITTLSQAQLCQCYPFLKQLLPYQSKAQYDEQHARYAAVYITLGGCVNTPNNYGITPFMLAQQNKTEYPQINRVMVAGSLLQAHWRNVCNPKKLPKGHTQPRTKVKTLHRFIRNQAFRAAHIKEKEQSPLMQAAAVIKQFLPTQEEIQENNAQKLRQLKSGLSH